MAMLAAVAHDELHGTNIGYVRRIGRMRFYLVRGHVAIELFPVRILKDVVSISITSHYCVGSDVIGISFADA